MAIFKSYVKLPEGRCYVYHESWAHGWFLHGIVFYPQWEPIIWSSIMLFPNQGHTHKSASTKSAGNHQSQLGRALWWLLSPWIPYKSEPISSWVPVFTYSTTAKMARTQINIPISNILFWIGNNFSMEYILSSNWENIEHTNSSVDWHPQLSDFAELPASEARSGRSFCTNWSGYQSPEAG